MRYYLLALCCFISLGLFSPSGAAAYEPWSERVFTAVEKEYGTNAVKRLRYLHELIQENQSLPVIEKLELVNTTLNQLPWIGDREQWERSDYWATPMEMIATYGGDCEDFAVAKWVVLTHLGIPPEHLRLAYVKIRATGENHMVLLYLINPSEPPEQWGGYVLDNYSKEVKKGSERKDLVGVYITDSEGTIVLIGDGKKGEAVKGVYKDKKSRKLDELIKKIDADRNRFRELNDNRDLFTLF